MNQPASDSELVVATPERVSFDYKVAGLATRGIAQLLDLLILAGVLLGLYFRLLRSVTPAPIRSPSWWL